SVRNVSKFDASDCLLIACPEPPPIPPTSIGALLDPDIHAAARERGKPVAVDRHLDPLALAVRRRVRVASAAARMAFGAALVRVRAEREFKPARVGLQPRLLQGALEAARL